MANCSVVARRTCKCYWIWLCDMSKNMILRFSNIEQGASGVGIGNFEEVGPLNTELKPRNSTWLKKADLLFVVMIVKRVSMNLFTRWLSIVLTQFNASGDVNHIGQSSWNRVQFCGGQKTVCENRWWSSHRLDYIVDWIVQQGWETAEEPSVHRGRVIWWQICCHSRFICCESYRSWEIEA